MYSLSLSFMRKACLAAVLLVSSNSHAGLIVISGELVGATDVVVSGLGIYDVSFQDGSCASVFSGCDALSDFAFTTFEQTNAAGKALLEQVFIDSAEGLFDSTPWLIRGCEDISRCIALIPNKFSGEWVFSKNIINDSNEASDRLSLLTNLRPDQSITGRANSTFAVFTPVTQVPAPATIWLLGSVLIALVGFKRKKS